MKKTLSLILSLLFLASWGSAENQSNDSITTTCTRVIDGDTIVISSGDKVKLIGVDAPEFHRNVKLITKTLGQKAWEFTNNRLKGKGIKLEFDPNNESTNHKDEYGRLLAYVYLKDGSFFNAQIIKDGYAHVSTKFPFKYVDEFRKYEKEARESHRGLWTVKE